MTQRSGLRTRGRVCWRRFRSPSLKTRPVLSGRSLGAFFPDPRKPYEPQNQKNKDHGKAYPLVLRCRRDDGDKERRGEGGRLSGERVKAIDFRDHRWWCEAGDHRAAAEVADAALAAAGKRSPAALVELRRKLDELNLPFTRTRKDRSR